MDDLVAEFIAAFDAAVMLEKGAGATYKQAQWQALQAAWEKVYALREQIIANRFVQNEPIDPQWSFSFRPELETNFDKKERKAAERAEADGAGKAPENEVHKRLASFLSKRDQGRVMGVLREFKLLYNPRDAKYQSRKGELK